jgi:flavodoxin
MNQVIYVSRKGNTKKVAEFIARGAGITASALSSGLKLDYTETLFVGGALYAGKIDASLRSFLEKLTPAEVGRVAVFSTSLGNDTPLKEVKSILEPKKITVLEENFHCKGAFLLFNGGRPNEEDLKKAEDFGKKIVSL